MNERIKQLAAQANILIVAEPFDVASRAWNANIEEFAELIVRECVNVALEQKKWVEDQEVFNPHDESWNRARIQQSQRIVDKINEHFGVAQ